MQITCYKEVRKVEGEKGLLNKQEDCIYLCKVEWMNLQSINPYEGDQNPKRETLRGKWNLIITN